jgi:hypothetical protein
MTTSLDLTYSQLAPSNKYITINRLKLPFYFLKALGIRRSAVLGCDTM